MRTFWCMTEFLEFSFLSGFVSCCLLPPPPPTENERVTSFNRERKR